MSKKEQRRRRELRRLQEAIQRQKAASAAEEEEKKVQDEEDDAALEDLSDWRRVWERFDTTDLNGKIALFREILSSGEMNSEAALEMSSTIHDSLDTSDPQGRVRYAELVEDLSRQAPDVYEQHAGFYRKHLIFDAVAAQAWADIDQLLVPFTEELVLDVEAFFQTVDQLQYHGRIQPLVRTMTRAWPMVQESDDLTDRGIAEFARRLMKLHLFDYLETSENPRVDDPQLLERTAPYRAWADGWREETVSHLTVSQPSDWEMADFGPAVDADQWRENLTTLLMEFIADRHRAGVPYSRGDMLAMVLADRLARQMAVPAEPFEITSGSQSGGKRRERRERVIPAPLPLVPRYPLLQDILVDLFPSFDTKTYHAAALMELLPSYVHFLARLGLIHPLHMDLTLDELVPLGRRALQILVDYGTDPHAVEAVEAAWAGRALSAIKEDPALAKARERSPEPIPRATRPSVGPEEVLVYTFDVTYLRDPEVRRTIEVTGDDTLDTLHEAILRSVGFDTDHLYSFFMSNQAWDEATEYSSPLADGPSATGMQIADLGLRIKQRFLYVFDYGDEHRFEVQLVDVTAEPAEDESYPRVVERHGEDPPQYSW